MVDCMFINILFREFYRSYYAKEEFKMNNKQIETSREIRLWMTRVVLPVFGITMMVPSAREAVVANFKKAKENIENAFKKN